MDCDKGCRKDGGAAHDALVGVGVRLGVYQIFAEARDQMHILGKGHAVKVVQSSTISV